MSEEQLKAAAAETSEQVKEGVEEISEEDLAGVAGGGSYMPVASPPPLDTYHAVPGVTRTVTF